MASNLQVHLVESNLHKLKLRSNFGFKNPSFETNIARRLSFKNEPVSKTSHAKYAS